MVCFKIKNISIKKKGVLAPMQEYTHLPFRLLCKDYGSGLNFTEMVNTKHIIEYKDKLPELDLLSSIKEDTPCAVQIFGNFKEHKATLKAASILDDYKYFDIIDFNLGCPSLKIINSKSGSYNLKQFDEILPTLKEVISVSKKPVTVKTRLGFSENQIFKIHSSLEKIGVSALSIHGRLATENYSQRSDFKTVAKIKEKSTIPIIYNGDIDENNYSNFYNFDGLMVGRASLGNPFIFKQIDYFSRNNSFLDKKDDFSQLFAFIKYCENHTIPFSKYKVSLIPFFKGKKGSSKIRENLSRAKNLSEVKEILSKLKEQ